MSYQIWAISLGPNECPFRPSTGIPILQICWEIEVYWCTFEETVELFVSIPPVHFYVICCMELLHISWKSNFQKQGYKLSSQGLNFFFCSKMVLLWHMWQQGTIFNLFCSKTVTPAQAKRGLSRYSDFKGMLWANVHR